MYCRETLVLSMVRCQDVSHRLTSVRMPLKDRGWHAPRHVGVAHVMMWRPHTLLPRHGAISTASGVCAACRARRRARTSAAAAALHGRAAARGACAHASPHISHRAAVWLSRARCALPSQSAFSCAQQAGWGKCNETFLFDSCHASCALCALNGTRGPYYTLRRAARHARACASRRTG